MMTVEFVYIAFIIKSYVCISDFSKMIYELDACCNFIPDWDNFYVIGCGAYIDGEMDDKKFDNLIDYLNTHPNIEIDHESMEVWNYYD